VFGQLIDRLRNLPAPIQFAGRVVTAFVDNQGFLLASAIAYHMLLAIVPFVVLVVIGLSHFVPVEMLISYIHNLMTGLGENAARFVVDQVSTVYAMRQAIGITGLVGLFVFSVTAFRSVQSALNHVFSLAGAPFQQRLWFRLLLPYLYAFLLALGLVAVTLMIALVDTLRGESVTLLGEQWSLSLAAGLVLAATGFVSELVVFVLVYRVVPASPVKWRHALVGGMVAAVSWELARRVVIWITANLSMTGMLYGSFAVLITLLITLEVAAVILLLGAQTIALYARRNSDSVFETGRP